MELVIKLFNNKTSMIGIKYTSEFLATRAYETLIQKFPNLLVRIDCELHKNLLSFSLISDSEVGSSVYKNIEYKLDDIKRIQNFFSWKCKIQFVHVFSKQNQLFIAKPFRKKSFVSVSAINYISEQGGV